MVLLLQGFSFLFLCFFFFCFVFVLFCFVFFFKFDETVYWSTGAQLRDYLQEHGLPRQYGHCIGNDLQTSSPGVPKRLLSADKCLLPG